MDGLEIDVTGAQEAQMLPKEEVKSLKLEDITVNGRQLGNPEGERSTGGADVLEEEEEAGNEGDGPQGDDLENDDKPVGESSDNNPPSPDEGGERSAEEGKQSPEKQDTKKPDAESGKEKTKEGVQDPKPETAINVDEKISSIVDERSNGQFKNIDEVFSAVESRVELKDDYIRRVVDEYNRTGDLTPFLEATRHDFKAMSPVDVLRYKFNKDHEGMSPAAKQRKFERDVLQKYYQDGNEDHSEEDVKFGLEEMKFDAEKVRNELVKSQEEYMKPASQPEKKPEAQEEKGPTKEQIVSVVKKNMSPLFEDGMIKVKIGDQEVNMAGFDIDKVAEIAAVDSSIGNAFASKDDQGNYVIDWQSLGEGIYALLNLKTYNEEIAKAIRTDEREKIEKELKNPSSKATPQPEKHDIDVDNPDFSDSKTQNAFLDAVRKTRRVI